MLRKLWKILWISTLSFFGIGFAGAIIFAIFHTPPEPPPIEYKPVDSTLTPTEQGLKVGDWIKASGTCNIHEESAEIGIRLTSVPPPLNTQTNFISVEGVPHLTQNLEGGSTMVVTGRISEIVSFEYTEGGYLPQFYINLDSEGCTVTASSP